MGMYKFAGYPTTIRACIEGAMSHAGHDDWQKTKLSLTAALELVNELLGEDLPVHGAEGRLSSKEVETLSKTPRDTLKRLEKFQFKKGHK